jgi:sugar porter (SP) family MFS transporter
MIFRTRGFLIYVTAVSAIAGFLYGYDTGVISGALLHIRAEYHLGHRMQEMVASSILVGAILGALVCGWAIERLGRRRTITALAFVYTIGAIASALAPSPMLLALARIFLGFAVGGSSQAVPVYIAELAPPKYRGHFVTTFNVAIGLGILTANIVAMALPHSLSWRWMIGGAAIPASLLLICSFRLPESPRWLVGRGDFDGARDVLAKVRTDASCIDPEVEEIREIARREDQSPFGGWSGLAQPWVRPAVVAALGVAAFTQLTGIEMMIYYAPTMLTGVGFSTSSALRASLWLGLIYAVMTALGLVLVDWLGRRLLSLVMLPGAALSLLVLGYVLNAPTSQERNAWLIVACLLSYMFFSAGGIQVVGWLTGSEMYPLAVRGAGTSAQATMVWGSDLLVTATALSMMRALGTGGTMYAYGAMNVLAFLFIYYYVPETAGRSLEDIEMSLRSGDFAPGSRAIPAEPRISTP